MGRKFKQYPYTQIDNYVFDVVMRTLSGNEYKVLNVILRFTAGWHQERDRASYKQIKKYTGIKSDTTISKCLKKLDELGYIKRYIVKYHSQFDIPIYEYAINYDFDIEDSTTPNNEDPTPNNGEKTLHSMEYPKETNKKISNSWQLVLNFLSISIDAKIFEKHFLNSQQIDEDENTITVRVVNKFSLDWVTTKLKKSVERARGAANVQKRIVFVA